MTLKVLDLFSVIGGFSLGLERTGGFETVAFCEIDPFCQKVLKKHWPDVPIYNDVRTLNYDGPVDVITGGYPCQPFSLAGKRQGESDDRHLWPAMFSLVKKHRPSWVIGENVAGHIGMGLDDVLSDLEGEAYAVRTFVIPACAVDAPHRRDRVWIVAHTDGIGGNRWATQQGPDRGKISTGIGSLADAARGQNDKRERGVLVEAKRSRESVYPPP
jgi:DNA (cytosine-5)-methyltransferase 1